jgi:hypothetical protein
MPNQILVIASYWLEEVGTWVFDDPKVGLQQEPGIPREAPSERFSGGKR